MKHDKTSFADIEAFEVGRAARDHEAFLGVTLWTLGWRAVSRVVHRRDYITATPSTLTTISTLGMV